MQHQYISLSDTMPFVLTNTIYYRLTPHIEQQREPHIVQINIGCGKFELLLTELTMAAPNICIQAWGYTSSHSSSNSEELLGGLQLSSIADITTALNAHRAVLYRIAATHSSTSKLHSSTIDDITTAQYSPAVGTVALRLQLLEPTSDTDAWAQRSDSVSRTSSEVAETGTTAVRIYCLDATNLPLATEHIEQTELLNSTAAAASSGTIAASSSASAVAVSSNNSSADSGSVRVGAVRCRMFLNNRHIGDSPWPLLQPSQQQLHTVKSVEAVQLSRGCPVWHADGSGCDLALQGQQTAAETAAATCTSDGCVLLTLQQHNSSSTDDELCVELYQRTTAGTELWTAGASLLTSHLLSNCAAASNSSKLRHDVLLATALQHTATCIPPSLGLYAQSVAACSTSSVQSLAVVNKKEGTVPRRWLRIRVRGHSDSDVTADRTAQCCLLVNRRLFGSCTSAHGGSAQQQWHGKFDVLLPIVGCSNPEIRVAMVDAHGFIGYVAVDYDTTVNTDKAIAQQLQVLGVADTVLARLACTTEVSYVQYQYAFTHARLIISMA
jgi:hypothetical protein